MRGTPTLRQLAYPLLLNDLRGRLGDQGANTDEIWAAFGGTHCSIGAKPKPRCHRRPRIRQTGHLRFSPPSPRPIGVVRSIFFATRRMLPTRRFEGATDYRTASMPPST